jgi:uncharacterized protein
VKEKLQLLIELQGMDSAIVKKRESVDALPKELNLFMKTLDDAQSVYEKLTKRFSDLEKTKREKERVLDEIQEKTKKLKTRISEIKTNKEYQAHLKEIESTEKEKNLVEDEILVVMESLETMQKGLELEHSKVKAEREKGEALREKLLKDTAAAERELEDLKLKRAERIANIPKDLYTLYLKIMESKKGIAVVEARSEVCQGCNMSIPPQLFVELKKNERIIQCPQCSRILYWNDEEKKTDLSPEVNLH